MIKKTRNQRVPLDLINDLERALDIRYRNNLINRKDLKVTEGFRLIKRMPEWSLALNKLKTLPKRRDLV